MSDETPHDGPGAPTPNASTSDGADNGKGALALSVATGLLVCVEMPMGAWTAFSISTSSRSTSALSDWLPDAAIQLVGLALLAFAVGLGRRAMRIEPDRPSFGAAAMGFGAVALLYGGLVLVVEVLTFLVR